VLTSSGEMSSREEIDLVGEVSTLLQIKGRGNTCILNVFETRIDTKLDKPSNSNREGTWVLPLQV
jgi:hypothetical protein